MPKTNQGPPKGPNTKRIPIAKKVPKGTLRGTPKGPPKVTPKATPKAPQLGPAERQTSPRGTLETVADWKARLERGVDHIEQMVYRGKIPEDRKRELQALLTDYEDQLHEINRQRSRPALRRQSVKKRGRSRQSYEASTSREDLGQGDHRTTTTTRTTTTVRKGKRPITERSSHSSSIPLDDDDDSDSDDSSLWGRGQRGGAVHALIESLRKKYKKNHVVKNKRQRRWG